MPCTARRSGPVLLFLCLLCTAFQAGAQNLLDRSIDFRCENLDPADALVRLSKQTGVNIVFSPRFFENCPPVSITESPQPFGKILNRLSACARVNYREVEGQIVFYRNTQRYTLSGFVVDAETGERLIGASVRTAANIGAVSNEFGFFSLTLEEGEYRFQVSCVGYAAQTASLSLDANKNIRFALQSAGRLPEVVVSAQPSDTSNARKTGADRNNLPLSQLRNVPMPGGESDLLRLTALQPGVQTGVDGLGGLHVRGGNADHNLILLDDVPVYNPSHALGLFSIFSPATVSQARLWKGDFPARYGGRMASVLDVRTKEGNYREYHAGVSAGLFAASATVEGPVQRDKSSFVASGRVTYFQPWVHFFSQRDNLITFSGDKVEYRYFDANLKWNYTFSEKHRLYVTLYSGGDAFGDKFEQRYVSSQGLLTDSYTLGSSWGNRIAAVRWNHILGNRLFSNTTLRFSRFFYQSRISFNSLFLYPNGKETLLSNFGQLYQTLIRDWSVKTDFTFFKSSRQTLRWGLSYTLHDFQPGALQANFLLPGQDALTLDSLANTLLNNERLGANALEAYFEGNWTLGRHWTIDAGLNGSVFQIRNTNYPSVLPRVRVDWQGRLGWSYWTSYAQTAQNLHQIGSFNVSLPFELWVPSTAKVPPESGWQAALGFGWTGKHWHFQTEGYYKQLDRVLSFLSANDALYTGGAEDASGWEDRVALGSGLSKGVEWSLEFNYPISSFTAAYTLSKSVRQFPEINSGRPFPFRFDRRHDVKVTLHQRIFSWLYADIAWYFATGNPITLTGVKFTHHSPESTITRDVYQYSDVNGYRLPAYHRLDVAFQARWKSGYLQHGLQFGAYNVYNRSNPFFLFVDAGSGVAGKAIQYTLLPLLPVLRYEMRF